MPKKYYSHEKYTLLCQVFSHLHVFCRIQIIAMPESCFIKFVLQRPSTRVPLSLFIMNMSLER